MSDFFRLFERYRKKDETKANYARRLGISDTAYYYWEMQPKILPRLETLLDAGEAAGIPEEEIIIAWKKQKEIRKSGSRSGVTGSE